MARDCHNCNNLACARSHRFGVEDCPYFTEKERRKVSSKRPHCSRTSCNRNDRRRCEILTDNDFGGRECPFYKQRE